MFGAAVILILLLVATFAPIIAGQDPYAQDLRNALQPPSMQHLFGTDAFGRDLFSRLIYGSRLTLMIVALVAAVAAPVGMMIGISAGFFGGVIDAVLMRITDVVLAFPSLVLALAFAASFGHGLGSAILAIALTAWAPIARLARAETLSIVKSDYIAVARLFGASPLRLLLRHVLPMCAPSVVVRLSLMMGSIVLTAAGLGFLGMGAQPPLAEWGVLIAAGQPYMLDHPWLMTIPGVAIMIVSLGFNLFGDGVRDMLDPRGDDR